MFAFGLKTSEDTRILTKQNVNRIALEKKAIVDQSDFFYKLDMIEMPLVLFCQELAIIRKTFHFWCHTFPKFAGSSNMGFFPIYFLILGYKDAAFLALASVGLYSVMSTFGKGNIKRRRPGSYKCCYTENLPTTSSFPSRHSMGAAVIATFTPFPFLLYILITFDRMAIANHYLSDCVVGIFMGWLCVKIAHYFTNEIFIFLIHILSTFIWKNGTKLLSACVPVLIMSKYRFSSLTFPLLFLDIDFWKLFRLSKKGVLLQNLLNISVLLVSLKYISDILFYLASRNYIPLELIDNPLYYLLESIKLNYKSNTVSNNL